MEKVKSYKELKVWRKGIELTKTIYSITENFPRRELFGMTSQMRRAVVSVPSNIAEGWSRNHTREYVQFLRVALGSLAELDTQLTISSELGYLTKDKLNETEAGIFEMQKMVYAMVNTLTPRL